MMKKCWVLFVACFVSIASAAQIGPGNCNSFEKVGNRVIFSCADNARVLIQLCSQSVVKVWYEPSGEFTRSNESFAVVNEEIEVISDIYVETQAQAYEIFTDHLRIRVNMAPFGLQIFDKYQKLLMADYKDKGHLSDSVAVSAYKVLRTDEQFFGLGEKSGSLNRRGRSFRMWNSDKPCYSTSEDPLYKSIPFFMSSYRYGIFFDNTYKSEFKFGSDSGEYYSFASPGGEMLYYFIHGNDYKEIISNYTKLTGNPIMPPEWAFGFSQSRGLLTNEVLTREIAKGYRDRNIPCDIIYQDIGWTQWLQDFDWRRENYQDPKRMLRDLADDGFKVIVSQDPVVSQANHIQWKEADTLDYFVKDVQTGRSYDMPWPWGGNCGVVDFTNPTVAEWWGALQQKPVDDGVKGFWTDMGEPAWSNEESTERLRMRHFAGMHDEIHNVYGLTWDKIVTEQFEKRNPGQRAFQMTRAGYAGMQRYAFGWSGDAGNGSNVLDGWNRLANQVLMGQSAGMGLIPFWSCDISGYCGDIRDYDEFAELYVRWLQFGVFNPISRVHHEGNNAVEPWLFGEEAERISKHAIELKYQLFPYLYSYGREAYDTGVPLMRAMILEYPDDIESLKAESQFMLGEELLVAPVLEKGAESKRLYLPEGEWIFLGDGVPRFKGGQWIDFPVTLETIPLFVKAGSIIPMMPVTQYIGQDKNYPVILKVFPSNRQRATFRLYEDDGTTNEYRRDIFASTQVVCESEKERIFLTIERSEMNGYESKSRDVLIEILSPGKPRRVLVNGVKIKAGNLQSVSMSPGKGLKSDIWHYDQRRRVIIVGLSKTLKKATVAIEQ